MRFERFDLHRIRGSAIATGRRHGARLFVHEYVPFAAWLLSWAAIGVAVGLADAVWLMAANSFVQAIRSLFLTQSFDAICARHHASPAMKLRARRLALRVDAGTLLACLGLVVTMALGFSAIGLTELSAMMVILTLGLPARTPAVLALDRTNIGSAWRIGAAVTLLVGASALLLLDLSWIWAALALALRDWGGLAAAWQSGRAQPGHAARPPTDLRFAEIAARTSMAARRRLVYRIGKIALGVLGPVGSIIARTGRGGGLDGRVARKLRVNPVNVGLLAMACSLAAFLLIAVGRTPATLLIASALARLTAASLSVLIWWRWFETGETMPDWLSDEL